jgi:hypothetical protein
MFVDRLTSSPTIRDIDSARSFSYLINGSFYLLGDLFRHSLPRDTHYSLIERGRGVNIILKGEF